MIIDNIPLGYIAKSSIHGNGLFAKRAIAANTILCTLDGQIMSWNYYDNVIDSLCLNSEQRLILFDEWNCIDRDTLLVRAFRTKYSLINHSREPNCIIRYNPIRVEAYTDIEQDDELTLDYRREPLRDEYLNGHGSTYL